MSTPLDTGIIGHFTYIFTVILGFAIVYGILTTTKILGEKKEGLNAIIALFVAFLLLLSPKIVLAIEIMAPWFLGLFIFAIFILIFLGIFGVSNKEVFNAFKNDNSILTIVIILAIIILIGTLYAVFGTEISKSSFLQFFTNPKILGAFVVLLIGGLSIRFLTEAKKITK